MRKIPEHIRAELSELIAEGLPVEQIAFMMRLDESVVREEMERVNTTRKRAASDSH
jgi:hypothetical protein